MPVFHTKTIQTILEPVALQVSTMVVLDEEAGQGGAMPDLSEPVAAVSVAVLNLVQVGKQTAESSEDTQLQEELPRAWQSAEVASQQLTEAAGTLKENARSAPGRKLLITGARGILEAVSDLLLTFDESEVRRIIGVCESVMEYVKVAEIIEIMSDLVIFIKNITPGLTGLNKLIDNRAKELTNPVHAGKLVEHCDQVKKCVPMLIASVKLVCSLKASGSGDAESAVSSRDWLMSSITEDLKEIIRILKIKTSKDELAQGDFSEMIAKIMGKDEPMSQQAFLPNFQTANQFLARLDPESADSGMEALDKCLADALFLADTLQDAEMAASLKRQVADLKPMIEKLRALKESGKLNSAEGRALAKQIAAMMNQLEQTMQEAITKEVVENFVDPTGPAKQMTNAALLEPTVADREAQWASKSKAFTSHAEAASRTALQVARSGNVDEATVAEIMDTIKHIQSLAPQLVSSSKIVLNNYGNEVAVDFMQTIKDEYSQRMEQLKDLVDRSTDSVSFLKASEAQIHQGLQQAKAALEKNDTETAMKASTTVAKQAKRVLDVARAEAENSEDVQYVERVSGASQQLAKSVKPMVMSCKKACAEKSVASRHQFSQSADSVGTAVTEIREVVEGFHQPPRPPTPEPELPPPPPEEDLAPERPPPPELVQEEMTQRIELPEHTASVAFNIVEAARDLQDEAIKWSIKDNSLIAVARQMALHMAEMGRLFDSASGDPQSRKELINLAKTIAKSTNDIIRLAKTTAEACTDRRLKQTLLQLVDRLPTISTQLKIISTVKATQAGRRDARADRESSETLVLNAQNLMKSVKEVVQAAQSATLKLKPGSAAELMWKRLD